MIPSPRLRSVLLLALAASLPAALARADDLPTNDVPSRQIRFSTREEADAKRAALVEFIWRGPLPLDRRPRVRADSASEAFAGPLAGLDRTRVRRVDRIDCEVLGLRSIAYYLHPDPAAREGAVRLAIVHHGHVRKGDALSAGVGSTIDALLGRGFDVIAMQMPLFGWNEDRDAELDGKAIEVASHGDIIQKLGPPALPDGAAFRPFLEPVVQVINHWRREHPDEADAADITMIGLSGGGWTTHMLAAIDTRVRLSIPVAGATTLYARRRDPSSVGDLEQIYAPLYAEDIAEDGAGGGVATWTEIFALGGYGAGRRQIMVTAEFDNCCFSGRHADAFKDIVRASVEKLGEGSWEHRLDSSHRGHEISAWVIGEVIAPAIAKKTSRHDPPTPGR